MISWQATASAASFIPSHACPSRSIYFRALAAVCWERLLELAGFWFGVLDDEARCKGL